MVKNLKNLLIAVLLISTLFLLPTIVKAGAAIGNYSCSYPSNDGTIKISMEVPGLKDDKQYEFSIVSKGVTPEDWFDLTEYDQFHAVITLSSGTKKIANVLAKSDDGQIFIREKGSDTYIINRVNVNLKLPLINSIKYSKGNKTYNIAQSKLYGLIGNDTIYTSIQEDHTDAFWQKVIDSTLINKFLDIKINNKEITELEKSLPSVPATGYLTMREADFDDKNDGLYLLWIKRTGDNCKEVYSVIVHDGIPEETTLEQYLHYDGNKDREAPTVEKIWVVDPSAGNVKTGRKIRIWVNFSEKIKGSKVPVLTIKFGNSPDRKIETGSMVNNDYTTPHIEYEYVIQKDDIGPLQTVSLVGGTITDEAGNEAKLSCPIISSGINANEDAVEEQDIAVESVTVDEEVTVEVGKTVTLNTKVKPDDATDKTVTYKSNDTSIATVTATGVVTGVKVGETTITVTTVDGNKTATCKVKVIEPKKEDETVAVESVTVDKEVSVEVGKTVTLNVKVKPDDATNKKVTYKSNDTSIATVDANGKVTGKKVGETTITVTTEDGKKTATCKVKVVDSSKDSTTATGKIPQTGVDMTLTVVILAVLGIAGVALVQYRRLKDVK